MKIVLLIWKYEVWYNDVDNDCSGGSDYDQDGDGHEMIRSSGFS